MHGKQHPSATIDGWAHSLLPSANLMNPITTESHRLPRQTQNLLRRQPGSGPVLTVNDAPRRDVDVAVQAYHYHDTGELENVPPAAGEVEFEDCSWTDVLRSMETASNEYGTKAETHRLRAAQRNKAVAMTLHSLTEMIPEQDGLSVLRGGLKTIFTLLQKRIENGERILRAFEDIPVTFSAACHAVRAYPDDDLLRKFVEELYDTLRSVIPKLTEVLLRKHKGSLPRRIFKQHPESEAHVIDSCLEAVSRASHRVTVRVDALANQVITETLRETRTSGEGVSRTQAGMGELLDGLNAIHMSQLEMERMQAARYEQLERNVHAFVEHINQDVQQRLGNCEAQFRTGFLGIQHSIQGIM